MTLETQYKNFLKDNPNSKTHFETWKKINSKLVEEALINMMKDDEELGLYNEPFKHKVEAIPAEEILANRSNAYKFIDFDKQETLEEASTKYANKNFSNKDPVADEGWYASWLGFMNGAKWQQERSYSEEDMYWAMNMAKGFTDSGKSDVDIRNHFEQFKKK